MKNYTDLKQSKKLADILPLETADAFYASDIGVIIVEPYITDLNGEINIPACDGAVPCWSLAALFDLIPKHIKDYNVLRIDINENEFTIWYDEIGYGVNLELPDIWMKEPVDACVKMILKLHEQKLL